MEGGGRVRQTAAAVAVGNKRGRTVKKLAVKPTKENDELSSKSSTTQTTPATATDSLTCIVDASSSSPTRKIPIIRIARISREKLAEMIAMVTFAEKVNELNIEDFKRRFRQIQLRGAYPSKLTKIAHEQNTVKCRYNDIVCLDDSRVILKPMPKFSGDFIHASWVTHEFLGKKFICTQGPLENTIADFWRMIWQERVEVIIMLCELCEDGNQKCVPYWPIKINESKQFNGITILNNDIQCRHGVVLTVLWISYENETRKVRHFQWKDWPDRFAPKQLITPYTLHGIANTVKSPAVVHCSAGIGRSGTFIMLEIVYRCLRAGKDRSVESLLWELRSQRAGAVQTFDQFLFIYYATIQRLINRGTVDPASVSTKPAEKPTATKKPCKKTSDVPRKAEHKTQKATDAKKQKASAALLKQPAKSVNGPELRSDLRLKDALMIANEDNHIEDAKVTSDQKRPKENNNTPTKRPPKEEAHTPPRADVKSFSKEECQQSLADLENFSDEGYFAQSSPKKNPSKDFSKHLKDSLPGKMLRKETRKDSPERPKTDKSKQSKQNTSKPSKNETVDAEEKYMFEVKTSQANAKDDSACATKDLRKEDAQSSGSDEMRSPFEYESNDFYEEYHAPGPRKSRSYLDEYADSTTGTDTDAALASCATTQDRQSDIDQSKKSTSQSNKQSSEIVSKQQQNPSTQQSCQEEQGFIGIDVLHLTHACDSDYIAQDMAQFDVNQKKCQQEVISKNQKDLDIDQSPEDMKDEDFFVGVSYESDLVLASDLSRC
ncbi:unnamed protein product [Anisakis simplex]|uniref:Protein-tyrosine phosphatase n=2 Tax=Anisakis simplex TaxID=6269 RepID=A0A0M3JXD3_ANISI|nr:unnamed protein product [Anisakis simplex]